MILTFLLSGSYLTVKMAMDSGGALWPCPLSQGKRVGYMTVWKGRGRKRGGGVGEMG